MSKTNTHIPLQILFLLLLITSCQKPTDSNVYQVVLRTNEDGQALLGSKRALIQQIRAGADIKVGWGTKGKTISIEHLSEPLWIAIRNEAEVQVLLDPHYVTTSDTSKINEEWRVTISTTGEFDAVWYDKQNGTVVRHFPQRHPMVWYAKAASSYQDPLFLEE